MEVHPALVMLPLWLYVLGGWLSHLLWERWFRIGIEETHLGLMWPAVWVWLGATRLWRKARKRG